MSGNTESELPAAGGWPKLAVKNFGPIAEGEVELRPLTVFAGPSNTGKSWLATLIYAFARHVNGDSGLPGIRFGRIDLDDNELENFPENPAAWLKSLEEDGVLRLTDGEQRALKSFLESRQEALKEELLRCFGLADSGNLVRERSAGGARVTFMNDAAPVSLATRERMTISGNGDFSLGVGVTMDEYRPLAAERFTSVLRSLLDGDLDDERNGFYSRYMRAELFDFLVGDHRYPPTHYLPADRGGIMHAHRVVVGALIQSASRAGLSRNPSLPALSGVLADFLERMLELTDPVPGRRSPRRRTTAPATSLERNVLRGKIQVERSKVDYPHFTYRPDGWKRDLSLMSVSSMVSELAPVALYLRHCVRQGDLLILEEPEAHLHPEMQVHLMHEIAGWVRQKIMVLITTHSEWVLEEIANLVAAGEGEKESGLKKQDVGMWLFEPNGTKTPGSKIREIEWSIDEGGFALDFDDVAMALHNKWAGLVRGIQ